MVNKKTFIEFILIALISSFICKYTFAEDVTITTYYPAPFGVYEELRAKKIGIGSAYMDTTTVNVADDNLIVEGNVGIGTTTPQAKLQVEDPAPDLTIRRTNNLNRSRILFRNSGGNYIANIYTTGAGNGDLIFRVGPNNANPQALPDRLTILNNGNVGIGTDTPGERLDVTGKVRMRTQTAAGDATDIVATKGYVDKIGVQYVLAQGAISCPQLGADKLLTSVSCPAGSKVIDCWMRLNAVDIPMWSQDSIGGGPSLYKLYTAADVATNSCALHYTCGGGWNGIVLGVKAVCLTLS
ncbi:MAG: hypothetical protein U9R31_01405 [Candidatus Omnitrophota bacterium]|nr:hypothetical protein [Candidatus Omnitrophota bacterium]